MLFSAELILFYILVYYLGGHETFKIIRQYVVV
jgi:hypothetical protein